jgi:membrane associated rhomboid family serine protease
MIIPIGHESDTVRRLPWITFGIMAICLLVHISISRQVDKLDRELELAARQYLEYYFTHPYLELDPEIKELLYQGRGEEVLEPLVDLFQSGTPDEYLRRQQQEELDQLAQRFKEKLHNYPFKKWGFIPAKKTLTGLITHMFLHGDWLHLLGNLFFLYLTGPFIEDVWGRPIYIVFYLIVGAFSALMFAAHYPHFNGPLIGASGAISGVMGAFLIRYWKIKIKFFYIFTLLIRGTFEAPAWLILPLWLALEILNARTMDAINPQGGGGVAHWAHIWGFAFGAIVGIGMKLARIEEKYVHPKIESQITYVNENLQLHEDAVQLRMAGQVDEAYNLLLGAVQNNPTYQDNVEALWDTGKMLGREPEAAHFLIRLMENEIRNNQYDAALHHYRQLKEKIPHPQISSQSKITLMECLCQRAKLEEAGELANELLETIDPNSPPGLLLRFAAAAMQVSLPIARQAVELCLRHPDIPADRKEALKAEIFELQAEPVQPEKAAVPNRTLRVLKGIPTGIKGENIGLEVEGMGHKVLPLSQVKLVSVIKIAPPSERAFLLIDLVLDDPAASSKNSIRVIRLSSRTFSAKKFVPAAQSPLEAFRVFISALLKRSAARPYPDSESTQLKRLHSFPTERAYEESILAAQSSLIITRE